MHFSRKNKILFDSRNFIGSNSDFEFNNNAQLISNCKKDKKSNIEFNKDRQEDSRNYSLTDNQNMCGALHSVSLTQNSITESNPNNSFIWKRRILLIDAVDPNNPNAALIGHGKLLDFDYHSNSIHGKGSIHLGIVTKILPGLQAVFIRYKNGRDGFLPFSEIDPIYLKKLEDLNFAQNEKEGESLYENELHINSLEKQKKREEKTNFDNFFDSFDTKDEDLKNEEKIINEDFLEKSEDYGFVRDENNDLIGFICVGQVLMVQIVKEERNSKGSSLSTFISLNGRYCIYMPNKKNKNTISKNIPNLIDKKRLDLILRNLKIKEGGSVFILANAIRANAKEIKQDYEILLKLWGEIKNNANKIPKIPAVVHYDEDMIKNIFFNINMLNVKEIVIDGKKTYNNAIEFARNHTPSYLPMIKIHNIDIPIFKYYGVDSAISRLFSNIVSLRSGGYIVLNKTEALMSIDVNSGKSNDEFCIEETALKTNLEAISEIMIQLKLRKISGLIVIDLIGMRDPYNAKLIETTTKRLSQHDKAKIQVYLIEEFSLLVLSRQRLGQSLIDLYGTKCHNCNGFGHIHSNDLVLKKLFEDLKIDIYENGESNYNIFANKRFLDFIINDAKNRISEFENNFNCSLRIHLNLSLDEHTSFMIERINNNKDESDDFKGKYRKMNDMITAQNKSNEDILSENLDLFKNEEEDQAEIHSINQEYNESRFENFSKIKLEKNNKFINKEKTYIEDYDQINEFEENFKAKNIIEEIEDSKKDTKKQTNNKNNHQDLQSNFEKKKNNTKTLNNNENYDKVSSLYKIWNDWLSM